MNPKSPVSETGVPQLGAKIFFDREGRWVGWGGRIRNNAGDTSSWHIHPASDTFVYIITGSITIEFGLKGEGRVNACAGDFFIIPAGIIHRELTSSDSHLDALVLRVGGEPEQIDVDDPDSMVMPVME